MQAETVKEVQHYLRTLSFTDNRLIPIAVDGYYGSQTEDAVKIFQRYYELPVSGNVDSNTWDSLVEEYTTVTKETINADIFPHPDMRLYPNAANELASFIQIIITSLSNVYGNFSPLAITGIYDDATVEQIKRLQASHNLEVSGIVDINTWNILATLYNTRPTSLKRA